MDSPARSGTPSEMSSPVANSHPPPSVHRQIHVPPGSRSVSRRHNSFFDSDSERLLPMGNHPTLAPQPSPRPVSRGPDSLFDSDSDRMPSPVPTGRRPPPWIPADMTVFIQPSDSSYNSLFDSESDEDAVPANPISYPSFPKLADFYFTKVLGQGSFGTVYLARSRYSKHSTAVKVTSKRNVVLSSFDQSLKGEAKILASLDHPFIIRIEFAFQNQDYLFVGLQVATNGTLSHYLDAYAPMSTTQALFYLSQITLALDYIHEQDIIHGDLKPENLLVSEGGYLKLTDFGLARSISSEKEANTCFGTMYYMAPEMIRRTTYGPSIDWWALGIIMYKSLFARFPFEVEHSADDDPRNYQDDHERVKLLIVNGRYQLPYPIDPHALSFMKRLLSHNPSHRLLDFATICNEYAYFEDVDWNHLWQKKYLPPFAPPSPSLELHDPAFDTDYTFRYVPRKVATRDRFHVFFKDFHYLRTPWQVIKDGQEPMPIPSSSIANGSA
ncbi:hypothetical protein PGTUg99_021708 [Puccinia graminis f. sp. tritici]|uniref:AGC protein kinase n=1 Tax=Puccinia graminis f. sp. tritici TaxID=56615 RepID=A0A5B0LTY2_PUCGR|nr:hypothetical protein PGTUg99_021708 [Puccinia graminis f. sp. tritici]